jgi:hypothetical protein
LKTKTAKELRSHLLKELALFEGIEKRFQKIQNGTYLTRRKNKN